MPGRLIIHCIVPGTADPALLGDLRAHFAADDAVQVVLDLRRGDRRASERGGRPPRSAEEDRRTGSDRRRPVLPREGTALPPALAARAAGVRFVQRMLPVTSDLHDLDVTEILARVRAGDPEAPTELYWRTYERIHSRLCVVLGNADAADRECPDAFGRVLDALDRDRDAPLNPLLYEAVDAGLAKRPETEPAAEPAGLAVRGKRHDELVQVIERDPAWFGRAQAERVRILETAGAHLVAVEHVGATSVPSIAARPVFDFILGTPGSREPVALRELLIGMGYDHCGRAGASGRTYYRMRGPLSCDLHVVRYDSGLWRDAITLREHLRRYPNEAHRWAAVRREAARAAGHSSLEYARLRAPALAELSARAAQSSQRAA